ncbi:MAG: hypothetical protein ACK5MU_04575 [Candidatus Saccharimonadales bacterium]
MRRKLAEAAVKMFVLAASDDYVSAKTLRAIAKDAELSDEELELCDIGIAAYIKRRSRMKQMLAKKGELAVLKKLIDVDQDVADRLRYEDATVNIGPFSYNVLVDSDKLTLIYGELDESNYGMAMCDDEMYAWSFVVRDRAPSATPEERLISGIFGGLGMSRTERHEDMHQFYAFLKRTYGLYGYERQFRRIYMLRDRENTLKGLNAPDIVMRDVRDEIDREIRALPGGSTWDGQGWSWIEEGAKAEIMVELCGEIKSELLAFLWSGELKDLEGRLRCGYLPNWIEEDETRYGFDLSSEFESLKVVIEMAVAALNFQTELLLESGVKGVDDLGQLIAMLNIDRPIDVWGIDM